MTEAELDRIEKSVLALRMIVAPDNVRALFIEVRARLIEILADEKKSPEQISASINLDDKDVFVMWLHRQPADIVLPHLVRDKS